MTRIAPSRLKRRLARVAHCASSALLLSSLLAGCGPGAATPVPEPPALQTDKIGIPAMIAVAGGTLTLQGAAGAAPPHATILVTDLDATTAAVATSAAEDGRFAITVPTNDGDEQRLVALVDGVRSRPFDFKSVANALVESPRPSCLTVTPGLLASVRANSKVSFKFENSCNGVVTLQAPRSRTGDAAVSFDTQFTASIASGASASFVVNVAASAAPTLDEVVFIDVAVEGQTIRYPLGVYGRNGQ